VITVENVNGNTLIANNGTNSTNNFHSGIYFTEQPGNNNQIIVNSIENNTLEFNGLNTAYGILINAQGTVDDINNSVGSISGNNISFSGGSGIIGIWVLNNKPAAQKVGNINNNNINFVNNISTNPSAIFVNLNSTAASSQTIAAIDNNSINGGAISAINQNSSSPGLMTIQSISGNTINPIFDNPSIQMSSSSNTTNNNITINALNDNIFFNLTSNTSPSAINLFVANGSLSIFEINNNNIITNGSRGSAFYITNNTGTINLYVNGSEKKPGTAQSIANNNNGMSIDNPMPNTGSLNIYCSINC
jgi:hypothetical protein